MEYCYKPYRAMKQLLVVCILRYTLRCETYVAVSNSSVWSIANIAVFHFGDLLQVGGLQRMNNPRQQFRMEKDVYI